MVVNVIVVAGVAGVARVAGVITRPLEFGVGVEYCSLVEGVLDELAGVRRRYLSILPWGCIQSSASVRLPMDGAHKSLERHGCCASRLRHIGGVFTSDIWGDPKVHAGYPWPSRPTSAAGGLASTPGPPPPLFSRLLLPPLVSPPAGAPPLPFAEVVGEGAAFVGLLAAKPERFYWKSGLRNYNPIS